MRWQPASLTKKAPLQGELDFAQQKTEGLQYNITIQPLSHSVTAPLAGEPFIYFKYGLPIPHNADAAVSGSMSAPVAI